MLFNAANILVKKIIALKKCLVGFGIHPFRLRQPAVLFRFEGGPDLQCDGSRHLSLKRQYIRQIALVLLRPKVAVIARTNQLRANSDLIACLRDSAFNDGIYLELSRNVRQPLRCATFVSHHRGARDDVQCGDMCEFADEFVGHAIREKFLGRIARRIFERQHGDGLGLRGRLDAP